MNKGRNDRSLSLFQDLSSQDATLYQSPAIPCVLQTERAKRGFCGKWEPADQFLSRELPGSQAPPGLEHGAPA